MVKYTSIIKIFLVFYLISLSFSKLKEERLTEIWKDWDYEQHGLTITKDGNEKTVTYGIDFPEGYDTVELYIKVEVIPAQQSDQPPLICFSTRDLECKEREQLIKSAQGNSVILWVKKDEISDPGQELYIMVETEKEANKYTIKFKGYDNPVFGPNFSYSFLVGKYNQDFDIIVTGIKNQQLVTLAIDGASGAALKVSGIYDSVVYEHKNGKSMSFVAFGEEGVEEFNKTVSIQKLKEGEYVTILMHITTVNAEKEGVTENGILIPNGPKIVGYINKELMTEECYPIDFSKLSIPSVNQMYVTGRINSKYTWMFLADEEKTWMLDYDIEVLDGHISFPIIFDNTNRTKLRYICVEIPYEEALNLYEVSFSFQLQSPQSIPSIYKFYEPQIIGEIYRYMIPKDSIAFFHGLQTDDAAGKYDFNIYTKSGVVDSYIDHCTTFPDCHYDESSLNKLNKLKGVNNMATWNTFSNEFKPYSLEKIVMVVKCVDDDAQNKGFCLIESSIFNKGQDLYLVEDEEFTKLIFTGEEGYIHTDLKTRRQISRLTIDIMIFSGDAKFEIKEKTQTSEAHKVTEYSLANKKFFHVKFNKREIAEFDIHYYAYKHTLFTIKYSVHAYNKEQLEEHIPSGESYLVNIDPSSKTKSKIIYLENTRVKNKNPFLANFFELNCEFDVTFVDEKIEFFDGYAQKIIQEKEQKDNTSYVFNIKIKNADSANYVNKMCMLYVAGYEIEQKYLREIVIPENVNQQIIFKESEKFKSIRFTYPHVNFTQEVSLFFNVIDKAVYEAKLSVLNYQIFDKDITRTQIMYIDKDEFINHCFEQLMCPITLELSLKSKIVDTDPMIEITFKQAINNPGYIQKGQAKRDYVMGDNIYYLYTELGKNEIGEVSLNFLREYGTLMGKVVRKDIVEKEFDWRGRYRMPSETWHDSLPFDESTKKLTITTSDTSDCLEGCFLLLAIRINQIGEFVPNYKFYPFSIITKLSPSSSSYIETPKVVIQVDEFIVGSVKLATDDKIYEFYEIWLPHDSEIVDFDWQSSVAGLYVNLGGIRPTTKNADFKLIPSGRQSVLSLSKEEIIMTAKEKHIDLPNPDSLQDVNLVIGVWTDKTDAIDSEIYSLRVHQTSIDKEGVQELDIIEVKTDQKILCRPRSTGAHQYRCLFMVIYDDTDIELNTPFLAYSHSTNPGTLGKMYMNYIDKKIYEKYDPDELRKVIPNDQVAKITAEGYINEKYLESDKYIFLSVVVDLPYDVVLVTSMPVFDHYGIDLYQFYPNPNTEQVIAISFKEVNITFPGTDPVSVSIVTLDGNGQIFWQKDPQKVFDLRGEGDRLTLTSGKTIDAISIINPDFIMGEDDQPPYIFYISYHKRKHNLNFDEIKYGKSLELSYKETDLPIILYNKVGLLYDDVSVSITFKDNEFDVKDEKEFAPIFVEAQIVKENSIYMAKKDPSLTPPLDKSKLANYDISIRTAQLLLTHDEIEEYGIKDEDNPTLYIRVERTYSSEKKVYEKFSVEAQVAGLNDGVIPVEKIYHYESAKNSLFDNNIHRLKVDEEKEYMRVHLAFNSHQLGWAISDNEEEVKNITFVSCTNTNGKTVVTIHTDYKTKKNKILNLIIFKIKGAGDNAQLNDYTFKYMNAKKIDEFMDYAIKGTPKLEKEESTTPDGDVNIKCTFDALDIDYSKVNVTYYLKIYFNDSILQGEEYKTIAGSNNLFYYSYERNPTPVNGKITLSATSPRIGFWSAINVVAQVQEKSIIEYVSYEPIVIVRPPPVTPTDEPEKKDDDDDEGGSGTAFIVVGVILIIVIIGLVGLIVYFQMKNKQLLAKVKTVSFQNTNKKGNTDPNNLIEHNSE